MVYFYLFVAFLWLPRQMLSFRLHRLQFLFLFFIVKYDNELFLITIFQEFKELQEKFQKLCAMKLYLRDQNSKVKK